MSKIKENVNDPESVTAHIAKLDPSIRDTVQLLREIILSADKQVGECIKWNNPSFFYTGPMQLFDPKEYKRWIIVFNLHKNHVMLVWPSGARVEDSTGLLEGGYKDGRKTIVIKDIAEAKEKENAIKKAITKWIKLVDK